jgi:hypothetical protein
MFVSGTGVSETEQGTAAERIDPLGRCVDENNSRAHSVQCTNRRAASFVKVTNTGDRVHGGVER